MKCNLIIAMFLVALSCNAARVFIGIKPSASLADKNLLASLIVEKLDKKFSKDMAVKYWKKTDHDVIYLCNNWNLNNGNIRSKFTSSKCNQWLDNNAGLFDNRNDIATSSFVPPNWEHVPEVE